MMTQRNLDLLRCYDQSTPYVPEFRFGTPAGFRDRPFLVPFSFTLNQAIGGILFANRLPVSLDDDDPFMWRGIIFPNAGLNLAAASVPSLIRLWDTRGNPLSDGLVLALGVWCQSGFGGNAYGFPFDDEIECEPGGVISFDFAVPAVGGGTPSAQFTVGVETITFTSTSSSGFVITAPNVQTGTPLLPLSVTVSGLSITVNFATDAGGLSVTPTFAQVRTILNGTAASAALITTTISGATPNQPYMWPFGESNLNANPAGSVILSGNLWGVKRSPLCGPEANQ